MSGVELTDKEKLDIVTEVFNADSLQLESIEALANGLAQEHISGHNKGQQSTTLPTTKEYQKAALAGLLASEKRFSQSAEEAGMHRPVDLHALAGVPALKAA